MTKICQHIIGRLLWFRPHGIIVATGLVLIAFTWVAATAGIDLAYFEAFPREAVRGFAATPRALYGGAALFTLLVLAATALSVNLLVRERRRVQERALSEQRLRDVLDGIPDHVWLKDREGRYVAVNCAEAQGRGVPAEQLIGKTAFATWPADVAERLTAEDRDAMAAPGPVRFERRSYLDGAWREIIKTALRSPDGTVTGMVGISRDITERRRIEGAQAQLAAIVENATVAIYSRTLDGTILTWNAGAEKMLGYSAAEMIGKLVAVTRPPGRPTNLARNNEDLLRGEVVAHETNRMTKDGRVIDVLSSHAAIRDGAGNIVGVSLILQDISALKRVQTQKRENEQRLQAVFDNAALGISLTDFDRRYLDVNDAFARMLGYTRAELIGRRAPEFMRPEDVNIGREERGELWRGERDHVVIERRYVHKSGRTILTRHTASAVRDERGPARYLIRVVEDITERRRMEEAEAQLAAIVKNATVAIYNRTLDGTILTWNAGAEKMLGFTAGEAIGKPIALTRPPGRLPNLARNNEELLRGGAVARESNRMTKDGRIVDVLSSHSAIRDGAGNIVGVSIVLQDITALKQAAVDRARLASIVENATVAIISRTLNDTILTWNPGAERMFGFTAAEVIGKPIAFTLPAGRPSRLVSHLDRLRRGKVVTREAQRVTRDGSVIDVLASHSPIVDGAGDMIGISTILQDITELKQTQAALQQSEERYRATIEQSPAGFTHCSVDGKFLEANRRFCEMVGYTREELLSMNSADLIHPEDRGSGRRVRTARLLAGQIASYTVDKRLVRKDRSVVWGRRTISLVQHASGGPAFLVGLVEDITEERETAERYQNIYEHSPLPMYVRDLETGRITDANAAALALYGYRREELLSMTPADLWPEQERQHYLELSRQLAPRERAFRVRRHRRKDGALIDVEITSCGFDMSGRAVRLILVNDVTLRLRADAALAAERNLLRAIIDAIPDFVSLNDVEGRYLLMNHAMARWHPAGAGSGGMPRECYEGTLGASIEAEDRHVLTTGESIVNLERMKVIDGETRCLLITKAPLRDAAGNISGVIGIGRDVTAVRRAHEALHASEARFRAIFEHAGVGITVRPAHARDGAWTEVNERMCEMLGYTREELLALSTRDITPLDGRDAAARDNARLLAGEVMHYAREKRLVRKDGADIWVLLSVAGLPDANGRLAQFIAVYQDVTGRRRAEAALAVERNLMRTIIDAIPDWVFVKDVQGRYILQNRLGTESRGVNDPEETYGGKPSDYFSSELAATLEAEDRQVLKTGEAILNRERVYAQNGEKRWRSTSKVPLRDPEGKVMGVVGIARDVTELRRAGEALTRERNLLRAVIDIIPDDIFVKDLERRYILVNAASVKARGVASDAAVIGKTSFDFNSQEDAAQYDAEDKAVLQSGVPLLDRQMVIAGANGDTRWKLTTKMPLRDDEGRVTGVVVTNRDITELRKSAEVIQALNVELEKRVAERTAELEVANHELEAFAYSVSHDLRAPLRSIDGFSQVLLEECELRLEGACRDYLRRVRAASQRMGELIDGLLALSRISRSELCYAPVDLSTVATQIAADLRTEDPERSAAITIATGLWVQGDIRLLRAALDNLLRNAWKFTGRKADARIEMGASENSGRTVYYVRDNGVGFDMTYAAKLFGVFQRLHTEREFPGTGIGLATVQRIVRRHGGEIWAEGEVNHGATFYFTLRADTDTTPAV